MLQSLGSVEKMDLVQLLRLLFPVAWGKVKNRWSTAITSKHAENWTKKGTATVVWRALHPFSSERERTSSRPVSANKILAASQASILKSCLNIHPFLDVKDLLHCVTCLHHCWEYVKPLYVFYWFPPVLICIKVYLAHNYCSRLQGRSSAGF